MLLAGDPATLAAAAACTVLVAAGAAVQVAVGAGLSVVYGFFLLWLGAASGVPTLLCLNLLVSVVATAAGGTAVRWGDVALASGTTLGMQDFRVSDGRYVRGEATSLHPAYPFHMSARDLARFGLLYARGGQWRGRQVVPAS